jgi:signal transduction histidine kinase
MAERSAVLTKGTFILTGALVLLGLYLTSLYNYLLFHSLAELFAIVVACGVFMVAWNARRFLDNNYLLFIGIAYLFVAGLDLLHTLAYKGMGVFPDYDANLPTQLWIASRYIQSLSLLIAPLFLYRKLKTHLVFLGYAVIISLLLASIFYWRIFPDCYIEGIGLTPFKKISEYLISLILLAASALLLKHRAEFDPGILRLLVLSMALMIGAELAFTFYVSVYGLSNLAGHMLKIVSFYLVYKAMIATALVKPYRVLFRNLKQSEAELRQYTHELQARNEELDAFAHTVAHDLRNPLALIISCARVLNAQYGPHLEKEIQELLRMITQTAFKMSNIIDELLLLAEVRKARVQAAPLDMATVVGEARQRLAQLMETNQVEIEQPDTWPAAVGYGPWIEEVWANYLSNGIKYGGQPPRLELGATKQSDGMIRFWVRDNGPGLKPEDQAVLFTPFTRLDQFRATGQGLGLSIVRRIVEKLDGQVGVESEPGQGSLFFFTLPSVN